MRWLLLSTSLWAIAQPVAAADVDRGRQIFNRNCAACHSLEPDKHMTGPTLSGLWGRKSGGLESFKRYSPAIVAADIIWSEHTLDRWLEDPEAFIPGNFMGFPGLPEDDLRADVIAFLKATSNQRAQAAPSAPTQGLMGAGTEVPNLKDVPPRSRVKEIGYCGDTYTLTMANGDTVRYWERNLRFKTDASEDGPPEDSPAIIGAGMVGDRASVIFAAPEEFGRFIKRQCPDEN